MGTKSITGHLELRLSKTQISEINQIIKDTAHRFKYNMLSALQQSITVYSNKMKRAKVQETSRINKVASMSLN